MGFGTLFFGYFLLLNITYNTFTDLIAALIIAMGLYKLSAVNRPFRNGLIASVLFSVIGLVELICGIVDMFFSSTSAPQILSYLAPSRYFAIAILTLFIFKGIEEVSLEVGLEKLAGRTRVTMPITLFIYAASAVLEVPVFESNIDIKIFGVASAIILIATLVIVTVNLVTIYSAYMKICMPEDKDNSYEDHASKFEFVNRYREHTEKKQQEYAEYKLQKYKKKTSKKKKK